MQIFVNFFKYTYIIDILLEKKYLFVYYLHQTLKKTYMNTKNNKTKNIQRIVDFWERKLFDYHHTDLSSDSEKMGGGSFVWANVLDFNSEQKQRSKSKDFKTLFSAKIERHYPHIHISLQGPPRGILKETLQDLNMDIKPVVGLSTWIENDVAYMKEGDNPPQIIDSDGPTISS